MTRHTPKPLPVWYGTHGDAGCGVTHIDGGCVIPATFRWSRPPEPPIEYDGYGGRKLRKRQRLILTITPKS